jgi:hypothetical protein
LFVVDVTDPTHPILEGSTNLPGREYGYADVALQGNYAYVADDSAGLRVIDISDPAAPVEVGAYDTPGTATRLVVNGNYVYLADGEAGLRVIDITDPTAPYEVAAYVSPGFASDLAFSGGYVYLAEGSTGMEILRLLLDKVNQTISPAGGSLTSSDGQVDLDFPSGAFTQTATITFDRPWLDPSPGNLVAVGHALEVSAVYSGTPRAANLAPGQVFTITVTYSEDEKGPALADSLRLYHWNGSAWTPEPSSRVDPQAGMVIATVDHFATWEVLGDTRRGYLPLIAR